MFAGWRTCYGDTDTFLAYNNKTLKLDLLNNKIYSNDTQINIHLYSFDEIREWFIKNLDKENIDINSILEAYLKINIKAKEVFVEENFCKNRTKKCLTIDINFIAYIRTDEKEYMTEKTRTVM
jgi:ferredoxin-fold anticodon binding domain-containing protein